VAPNTNSSNVILFTQHFIKTSKHGRYEQSYLRRTTRIHLREPPRTLRTSVM